MQSLEDITTASLVMTLWSATESSWKNSITRTPIRRLVMADMTYCDYLDCPFKDCERHLRNAPKSGMVSIANLAGVCRRYIGWLVEEADNEQH